MYIHAQEQEERHHEEEESKLLMLRGEEEEGLAKMEKEMEQRLLALKVAHQLTN